MIGKSSFIKRVGSSNGKVDEIMIKASIVSKVNMRTFQFKTAKSKNLI